MQIELGNYDSFYESGRVFSASEVSVHFNFLGNISNAIKLKHVILNTIKIFFVIWDFGGDLCTLTVAHKHIESETQLFPTVRAPLLCTFYEEI